MRRSGESAMPEGFGGGSPDLWDREHELEAAQLPDHVYFRSAPARAIRAAALQSAAPKPGDRVLELGCGASRWLGIFAEKGADVFGVDFSPAGLRIVRERLSVFDIPADHIVSSSIDDFADANGGAFDIVVSFGLIEHFDDLEHIIGAHVRCTRPGGRVFVTAPNLAGANLWWTHLVAEELLTWHRPISSREVADTFRKLGCLEITEEQLGGPRWFAEVSGDKFDGWQQMLLSKARRGWNGMGELACRVSPRMASRLAGRWFSPHFGVSALVPAS